MTLTTTVNLCIHLLAHSTQPMPNSSFESWTENGFPTGWHPVGQSISATEDAHTGERAIRFTRGPDAGPETGLNLRWEPYSGKRDCMLAVRRGGLVFWYKAISGEADNLRIQAIPMSEDPFENTGQSRVTFTVPEEHVGDGEWHEGRLKYDFTNSSKVKWIQVSPRLVGGEGELLLDDILYVERVGAILEEKWKLEEDLERPGHRCSALLTLMNRGDEPSIAGECRLVLPSQLKSHQPLSQPLPALSADEMWTLHWQLEGKRKGASTLTAVVRAGELSQRGTFSLCPLLELRAFLAHPFLISPAEPIIVEAQILNQGTASFSPITPRLDLPSGWSLKDAHIPKEILPQRTALLQWTLICKGEGKEEIRFHLDGEDTGSLSATSQVQVSSALTQKPKHLGGALWVREGVDDLIGEIRLGKGHGSHTVARLPHLGRVTTHPTEGDPETIEARPPLQRIPDGLRSTARDSRGGQWAFEVTVKTTDVPFVHALTFTAQCDQPRDILAFEGPMIYAGEGMRTFVRSEGLFPGLEWLTSGELSSDDTDIDMDHPDRIRHIPHPNKVTIPFMSVRSDRDLCIALLWDVHHRWDGKRDRLQPVYASPDRFRGRAAHLMGLMVPNVDCGLEENESLAKTPYPLAARSPLRISCAVMVRPDCNDVLAAMDTWFALFRPDPVLPPPQGTYKDQVVFAMKAYTDTLFLGKEEGWLPFLGGPTIWRNPSHNPQFCFDLLMSSQFAGTPEEQQKWTQLAREQLKRGNALPRADDLGLGSGGVLETIERLALQSYMFIDSMEEDGSWRFDADRKDQGVFKGLDYHELGKDRALELGLLARKTYEILRYVRISGDWEAYEACKKPLGLMSSFEIPRAAQVWEVPVHSPDILAAADAIDAFLEAYRLTGEPRWLKEAQRWARTGLPFVYVWNEEGKPWMRYGSIPVFGASWMQCSWFGVLVQWNGLRYAYALLKLNAYDDALQYGRFTWNDIARGITHSAMYQQSPKKEILSLWPDSYNCMTCERAAWDFPPRLILKNLYTLVGREEEPQSVIWHGKTGPIHLTTTAELLASSKRSSRIEAKLRYPAGENGYTVLAGVEKPQTVRVDGKECQEVVSCESASRETGPCWRYEPRLAAAFVRVFENDTWRLCVEGVRPAQPQIMPKRATRPQFDFGEGSGGWMPLFDVSRVHASDGILHILMTGGDPYISRPRCHWKGTDYPRLWIRMRLPCGETAQLYWQTAESPGFDENKALHFPVYGDNAWHEYKLDLADHPFWMDQTITSLRLDPTNGCTEGEAEVDYITWEHAHASSS